MLWGKGNPIKRIHSDSVQPVPITRTSLPLSGGCGSKGQFSGERAPPSGRSPALTRKERLKGELDATWRMPRAMPGALRLLPAQRCSASMAEWLPEGEDLPVSCHPAELSMATSLNSRRIPLGPPAPGCTIWRGGCHRVWSLGQQHGTARRRVSNAGSLSPF